MRPGHKGALALAFVLALVLVGVAGCGNNDPGKEADEGVPIQLGDLKIIVQETRFLNPSQPDDNEYLQGQQVPPPAGKSYLGVFLTMENTGDSTVTLPTEEEVMIADTTGVKYPALASETDFSAPLGAPLPPGGEIPVVGTAGFNGPVQAALVIFLVDQGISENRPLKLEIEFEGEAGEVVLDI